MNFFSVVIQSALPSNWSCDQVKRRRTRYYFSFWGESRPAAREPASRLSSRAAINLRRLSPRATNSLLRPISVSQRVQNWKVFSPIGFSLLFFIWVKEIISLFNVAIDSTSVLTLLRSTLSREANQVLIDQWESLKPLGPRSFLTQALKVSTSDQGLQRLEW